MLTYSAMALDTVNYQVAANQFANSLNTTDRQSSLNAIDSSDELDSCNSLNAMDQESDSNSDSLSLSSDTSSDAAYSLNLNSSESLFSTYNSKGQVDSAVVSRTLDQLNGSSGTKAYSLAKDILGTYLG